MILKFAIFLLLCLFKLSVSLKVCTYYPNYPSLTLYKTVTCSDICCASIYATSTLNACCYSSYSPLLTTTTTTFQWWWIFLPLMIFFVFLILVVIISLVWCKKSKKINNWNGMRGIQAPTVYSQNGRQIILPAQNFNQNFYQPTQNTNHNLYPQTQQNPIKVSNNSWI